MPPRIPKCSYYEGARKCSAASVGGTNPPLCRAHRAVLEATAQRRAQHPVVGGLEDIFGAWTRGEDIHVEDVIRSGAEMAAAALGSMFQGRRIPSMPRMPPMEPMPDMPPMGDSPWGNGQARPQHPPRQPPPRPPGPSADDLARARRTLNIGPHEKLTPELLKARYRKLAVKHHPDRPGGSVRRSAEVNAARDVLEATLKR